MLRASPWTPLGELTALPQTPELVGRGWLPLPKNTIPCSRPFRPCLSYPHSKISSDAVVEEACNHEARTTDDQVRKKIITRYTLTVGFPTGTVNFLLSGSRPEISLFNHRVPDAKYPILAIRFPTCRHCLHSYSFNVQVDITQLQTDRQERKTVWT